MDKAADAFRTISEAAEDLGLPQHVLRFWETRFPQIKPLKRAGGRRFYRPADMRLLGTIRRLLYEEGYTIKGVQRLLKEQGLKALEMAAAAEVRATAGEPDSAEGGEAGLFDLAGADVSGMSPAEPSSGDRPADLHEVLAMITECEAILQAARAGGLAS